MSNNIIADVSNKPFVRCIRINNQERKNIVVYTFEEDGKMNEKEVMK